MRIKDIKDFINSNEEKYGDDRILFYCFSMGDLYPIQEKDFKFHPDKQQLILGNPSMLKRKYEDDGMELDDLFEYLNQTTIPIVWTFHDCWSITGHCCHFDYVGCEKWKTECNNCPQIRDYPASLYIDRSRKNHILKKELFTSVKDMTIVTVSKWLKNVIHDSFLKDFPTQVIYNGVDIDIFTPAVNQENRVKDKLKIGTGFMILGVAGVWSNKKGLGDFVELSKRITRTDFIVLVGLTNSQKNKLPPNIIGITHTENQQELKELYTAADMYMNLSVEETFGLTTAEALACGTPAVVYNATACPEVIDADTGIVVEKKDINGLINAIEIVKKQGKNSYSAACRVRAVTYFNKDDRFAEYIDLFDTIIKSKTPTN